jgi:hypothetical protein
MKPLGLNPPSIEAAIQAVVAGFFYDRADRNLLTVSTTPEVLSFLWYDCLMCIVELESAQRGTSN